MSRTFATVAVAMLALGAGSLQAQVRFGPHLAYGDDLDFAIGARLLFDLQPVFDVDEGDFDGLASFSYYLDPGVHEGMSAWELDAAVAYNFIPAHTVRPFLRGGINVTRTTWESSGNGPGPGGEGSDTELGLGLGGGIYFELEALDAFADGRINLGGAEQFVLAFGILFGG